MRTVRVAAPGEVGVVLEILNAAAADLHDRGIDQWPDGFSEDRIAPYVALREVWLVCDGDLPLATCRVAAEVDADFWTEAEARDSALYVSKVARYPGRAPGVGHEMLRWMTDRVWRLGHRLVRLDAWRTNGDLHGYYADRGWQHVRTMEVAGRRSGALFVRPAVADPAARAALIQTPPTGEGTFLAPGTRVKLRAAGRAGMGVVLSVRAGDGDGAGWLDDQGGEAVPTAGYWVAPEDGGEAMLCRFGEVQAI